VTEIERRLAELHVLGVPSAGGTNLLSETLIAQLEEMRDSAMTNWGPIVLRAPISGMVSVVYRQQHEHIAEGEPLVTINSDWAERIVGYLRQPYTIEPQAGMSVHVTTREHKARKFWSEITQVGAQLETITNSLAIVRQGTLLDAGLPVVVQVPKGMRIRPGETVDLVFRARAAEHSLIPATDSVPASPEQSPRLAAE
jgi:hypothetical protein